MGERTPIVREYVQFGRDVLAHRELIAALVKRELLTPVAGASFGLAWVIAHPLLLVLVYLTVFSLVFELRFGPESGLPLDYASYMISGVLSWLAWASVATGACQSVLGNAELAKQPHFPSSVLPVRTVASALIPHGVGLAALLAYVSLRFQVAFWSFTLLPLALLFQTLAMVALAYVLGAFTVFVRDLKELLTVFVMVGIYLVPAFYTPEMIGRVHPALSLGIELNPFTHYVHIYRDCLFWGGIEHPLSWLVTGLLALFALPLAYRTYQRLQLFFGNFL